MKSFGGLLGVLAMAALVPCGFVIIVFFGNFNMSRPTHLLILLLGCLGPLLSLASSILLIARPHPRHLWLALLAVACVTGFFWALSLPGAQGIIH